jgi:hypothetical protein
MQIDIDIKIVDDGLKAKIDEIICFLERLYCPMPSDEKEKLVVIEELQDIAENPEHYLDTEEGW